MRWKIPFAVGTAVVALLFVDHGDSSVPRRTRRVTFEVKTEAAVAGLPRIGLNLGHWTSWGAEQLSRNVLKNPGFEGNIDRAIAVVRSVDGRRFTDSETWLARPDGFWSGATAHVLNGSSMGETLEISGSGRSHDGFPVYETEQPATQLRVGDAVALTKTDDLQSPALWWPDPATGEHLSIAAPRPGSPGVRSLKLSGSLANRTAVSSYLDMIGDRAGKLLPLEGQWNLSFWYRAPGDQPLLTIMFRRHGTEPFLSKVLPASSDWTQVEFSLVPQDTGPPGPIELRFTANGGPVWIDDVELAKLSDFDGAFREEVITTIRKLHPGYLRDWQGQLGDTAENRLASPFARRTTRYRPGKDEIQYQYSLPDFIALCAAVRSNPWVVIPTTLTDEEAASLGRYLRTAWQQFSFEEILVEFGNENWNMLFRPAGLPDPRIHGNVAERVLERIRREAGTEIPLRTVVNGQFAAPHRAAEFATNAPSADILAVAPYYLHELQAGLSVENRQRSLVKAAPLGWAKLLRMVQRPDVAVYEINAHALGGDASEAERSEILAGPASGTALVSALLAAARAGVRRQCIYTLAGYDAYLPDKRGLVKLFGITRNIASESQFRPTGLAAMLLNRVLPGDLHEAHADRDSAVEIVAFRQESRWSFVAVSASPSEQIITVRFPGRGGLPAQGWTIAAEHNGHLQSETNSRIEAVPLSLMGRAIQVKVPPFGVVVGGDAERPGTSRDDKTDKRRHRDL